MVNAREFTVEELLQYGVEKKTIITGIRGNVQLIPTASMGHKPSVESDTYFLSGRYGDDGNNTMVGLAPLRDIVGEGISIIKQSEYDIKSYREQVVLDLDEKGFYVSIIGGTQYLERGRHENMQKEIVVAIDVLGDLATQYIQEHNQDTCISASDNTETLPIGG